jgi:hypothetical protein
MCDGGGGDSGGGGGDFGGGGDYDGGGGGFHDDHHHDDHYGHHDNHHHYGNDSSDGPRKKIATVMTLIVTCCLAISFMIGGIALSVASRSKLDNLSSTEGTIIDTKSCSGNGNTEAAVIEYFDPVNNSTFQFTTSSCSSPGPTVGKAIKVLYDPEFPGVAYDGSFMGLWLLPLIVFGIAVIALIGCCTSLYRVCTAFAPKPPITKIEQPSLGLTPSYPTAAAPSAPPIPYKTSTEPEIVVNPYSTTASSNQYSTTNSGQTSSNTNAGTSIFDQLKT